MKSKIINWTFVLCILIGTSFAAVCDRSGSTFLSEDFEEGIIDYDNKFNRAGNVLTTTNSVSRSGDNSMEVYLNRETSPTSYRSQVVLKVEYEPNANFGEDWWYGFSMYFPEDYEFDTAWESPVDWHNVADSWSNPNLNRGQVPLSLKSSGGNWKVTIRSDQQRIVKEGEYEFDSYDDIVLGEIEKGVWTDWVFHVKWDYRANGNGKVEVWKNGEKVIDHDGPNAYNDIQGPYFKFGMYKGWKDFHPQTDLNEVTIYYDDIRVARGPNAKYGDVATECYAGENSGGNNDGSSQSQFLACGKMLNNVAIPSGYGSSYDIQTGNHVLRSKCRDNSVQILAGWDDPNVLVYNKGYIWKDNRWEEFTLTGESSGSSAWLSGVSTKVIDNINMNKDNFVLAYICRWTGSQWKCGCRDSTCSKSYWNLQIFPKE